MTRVSVFAVWMLVSVAAVAGCQTPGELRPQAKPVIADVPWPEGFSYDDARSRSDSAGGVRFIDHQYKGQCSKFDVQRFYDKHMVANQWAPVRNQSLQGDIWMIFRKGNELCMISITDATWPSKACVRVLVMNVGWADEMPRR